MAIQTLNGPQYGAQEFNTGDSAERGDSAKVIVTKANANFVELYATVAAAAAAVAAGAGLQYADVTVSSAELLALNATPKTILAAPAAGFANLLEGIVLYKAAGTAYAGIAAGEDLSVKYTDAAGAELARIETTGFLDQATAQTRYAAGYRAASAVNDVTPTAAAALVLHLLVGEVTTGTSALKCRVYYRVIPTVLT